MKQFDDYKDGDLVTYKGGYTVYSAFKSKYTHNAFRLKNGSDEIVADISEISPAWGNEHEKSTTNLQPGFRPSRGTVDSDADASGIYHIYDDFRD